MAVLAMLIVSCSRSLIESFIAKAPTDNERQGFLPLHHSWIPAVTGVRAARMYGSR